MAEKKTQSKEVKALKPITLRDDSHGELYVLEFDRYTVKFSEARGFRIASLDEGVNLSAIEDLFFYAFRKHQPNMSKADTDNVLYEKLHGLPEGMLERLVELYLAPFNTLIQSEGETKNSTMTVEF